MNKEASTMNMDFPNVRGIAIDAAPPLADAVEAVRRSECTTSLIHWASINGLVSRNSIKLCINEHGHVVLKAQQFVPAGKHLLHVPFKLDLSFNTLKYEVDPDKNWVGWQDLRARIKAFEQGGFQWHPHNYDQKDNFSKNLVLVTCIMGVLKKIADTDPEHFDQVSDTLKTFSYYWDALPSAIGSVLCDWSSAELSLLQNTSFFNCLPDAKRFGWEIYQDVFQPFISQYPDKFIVDIDIMIFMKVNSIVCTRSFAHRRDKSALLPVTDLVNGKSNDQHNCSLESCAIQKEVDGEFIKFHALTSTCDISAGEELFLEYAQVGNGSYLLTYNHIPLDPEIIMNNQRTDVFLDLGEFLETELLRMHPNHPRIRQMKRLHIYGFFNLPKMIPMSMEDLFSQEYSCVPSIRQVLIFLQFNEQDAAKAIETSRIKSQLNPHQLHQLFLLFLRFIETSIGKPNIAQFRLLLPASSRINSATPRVVELDSSDSSDSASPTTAATTATSSSAAAAVDDKVAPATVASTASAAFAAAGKIASSVVGSVVGTSAAVSSSSSGKAATTAASNINKSSNNNNDNNDSNSISNFQLTENMRSAIFLQMSERLVIEVMINRFINLFPENFHELGYSLMREHLVSTEINAILEELCRPVYLARAAQCMVCGTVGSMSKCSRCRKAYYCSAACQKAHWQYHKKLCRHLCN